MLWAITCYFNPCRYATKLANYRQFRRRLGVPVVTVELACDGRHELVRGDADRLVQLSGGDVLWQKERLLNVAIDHLPGDCDAVAWVDADVIFDREDWSSAASAHLETQPLLQPFSHMVNLPRHADRAEADDFAAQRTAVAHALAECRCVPSDLAVPGSSKSFGIASGRAWVATRELLGRHRLYDGAVIGGGDKFVYLAALGLAAEAAERYFMTASQTAHYLAWARPFHADIQGRVGCMEGRLLHLWHGSLTSRRYTQRFLDFARYDFDPFTDISIDQGGCWRWNSHKPAMHAYVSGYFASRDEDGSARP